MNQKVFHSIIIPTAGKSTLLALTVDSVLNQIKNRSGVEILLVDNNYDVEISEFAFALSQKYGHRVIYIREKSPGLTAARHTGARSAVGEIISFIDDDILMSDSWLDAVQDTFSKPEVNLTGGPTVPLVESDLPLWIRQMFTETPWGGTMLTWLSLLDIGKDVENIHPNYVFGLNFSIRKSVLMQLGGFHPDNMPLAYQMWQGDGETGLTMKFLKAGMRADYVQSAKLFHFCPPERLTLDYFLKRAYYQGVADSFSALRSNLNAEHIKQRSLNIKSNFEAVVSHSAGKLDVINKYTMLSSIAANFDHLIAVKVDPKIFEWVKKTNFLNLCINQFILDA